MTAASNVGRAVAGYRLLRRLGQGAHGTVYLAEANDGQPVALKLVALGAGSDAATARAAFLRSADTARRLVHPGIVAVHDAGIEAEVGWLAMEPVPGSDLSRYTRPQRLLPEALVLKVALRLALALAHAHGQGVVHRDLKPPNVLVDWSGDAIKLADFGLARAANALRTGTGIVPGSPAYMAPEQLAGSVPTPQSDFYALGVIVFELLTGRLPHEGRSMGELLRQVAQQPAPALAGLRPELPLPLAQLVARLLAKQADERPADGAELVETLHRIGAAWPAYPSLGR